MEYTRIINGYCLNNSESQEKMREDELKDITITYLSNGEPFTNSVYKRVSEAKISKINEKLLDYTQYNLNAECLCNAISLLTIISEIERIIYSDK